jgi:hypothetical protein
VDSQPAPAPTYHTLRPARGQQLSSQPSLPTNPEQTLDTTS